MVKWIKRFFDWSGTAYTYTGGSAGNLAIARRGWKTSAGPLINEESAMTIPAFFHGLRTFGTVIGSLHWDLLEHNEKGKSVARTHPVHRLLHDEPNEFQVASAFRETIVAHSIAYGNGYAYIERNGNMRPIALIPLLPDRTYPVRTHGDLQYLTFINGRKHVLSPYDVFHLTGFSVNGLTGIPLVRVMAESLGLSKAEENFCASFFGNGCNFGGSISAGPNFKYSKEAILNLKESMSDHYAGTGNAFRWIFLEEGLTASQFGTDPEAAQMVESRKFTLSEIARIIGLPPHMLFDLERATFSNIEHQGIQAVQMCFGPLANKLCQEANRKLLYESEKGLFEAVIDLKPLMAGDAKSQAERDQIRFNCCSLTPNEMRAKDGLNPIEGGDQLFVNQAILPLNVAIERALAQMEAVKATADITVSAGDQGIAQPNPDLEQLKKLALDDGVSDQSSDPDDDNPPPPGKKQLPYVGPPSPSDLVEDANALATPVRSAVIRPIAHAIVSRLLRRECKAIENAVKRHGWSPAFTDWLAGYRQQTRRHVAQALRPISETVERYEGRQLDCDQLAEQFVTATASDLDKVQTTDDVTLMMEGWVTQRADTFTDLLTGDANGKAND